MPSLPFDQLRSGSPDTRAAAAASLSDLAASRPTRLHGSVDHLVEALSDDHEPVRRAVAIAICEVGVDDPAAVSPVAEPLVEALTDDAPAVRRHVARPLADLAAARPRRVRFAVDRLVPSLTDTTGVRTEIARALAALGPRYPEVLAEHIDALTRSLLDDHPPVQRLLLGTLVPLERAYPGLLDVVTDRLETLTVASSPGVRQAACRAVAAAGPPWARDCLRDRSREDSHPVVRETAEAALARLGASGTPGDSLPSAPEAVFTDVTLGTWVVVCTDRDPHSMRVGTVTAITNERSDTDETAMAARGLRREDFDSREEFLVAPRIDPSGDRTAVHLHDPFQDAGLNLLPVAHGIGAEYTSPDRTVPSLHRPTDVFACRPTRARLLAATPGDHLAFELEGSPHRITVTTADTHDGNYRVTGYNRERGYRITFRPLGDDPLMAVFEKGRAFQARNVQLTTET